MRKLFLALIAIFSTLFLTACGKYDVTFWHTFGKKDITAIEKRLKDFTKKTGITVKLEQKGGYQDIKGAIDKTLSTNNRPNLVIAYPDHVASFNENRKNVLDLTKFINEGTQLQKKYISDADFKKDWDEQFYDFVKESPLSEKGIYTTPFGLSTEVILYNKELAAEIPNFTEKVKTWEGIWEMAKEYRQKHTEKFDKLVDLPDPKEPGKTKKQFERTAVFGYDSDANMLITMAKQYGLPYTDFVKKNGELKGDAFFHDTTQNKELVEMLDILKGYAAQNLFTTGATCGNKYNSTAFKNKQIVFTISSSGGVGYNIPDKNNQFEVGMLPLPQPELQLRKTQLKEANDLLATDPNNADFKTLQHNAQSAYDVAKAKYPNLKEDKLSGASIFQGPSIAMLDQAKEGEDSYKNVSNQKAYEVFKFLFSKENVRDFSLAKGYAAPRKDVFETQEIKDFIKENKAQSTLEGLVAKSFETIKDTLDKKNTFQSIAYEKSSNARTVALNIIKNVLTDAEVGKEIVTKEESKDKKPFEAYNSVAKDKRLERIQALLKFYYDKHCKYE